MSGLRAWRLLNPSLFSQGHPIMQTPHKTEEKKEGIKEALAHY